MKQTSPSAMRLEVQVAIISSGTNSACIVRHLRSWNVMEGWVRAQLQESRHADRVDVVPFARVSVDGLLEERRGPLRGAKSRVILRQMCKILVVVEIHAGWIGTVWRMDDSINQEAGNVRRDRTASQHSRGDDLLRGDDHM